MKKKLFILITIVLAISVTVGAFVLLTSAAEVDYNYTDAFAKSIMFYEANWCGPDAGDNRLAWRGACHVSDGEDVGLDLSGGFHDCGDHVKFGLPQAYSASTLGWAFYEFKDTFIEKGQDEYMLNVSKHFADYFMKCFPDDKTLYYQCGDGDTDHSYWGPPEMQPTSRPTYYVGNPETPASDVAGDIAASLTLMYLNYGDIDGDYADTCLDYAKRIYNFGMEYRGNSFGQNYYRPNSYYDELMWGAVWLYIATNDTSYLDDVETLMTEKGIGGPNVEYYNHWTQCWDDVFGGVFLKMAQVTDNEKYKIATEENLNYWMNELKTTPGGLRYLHQWGVLKYAGAESFIALVYNKTNPNQEYVDFAKSQVDYILGSNPRNSSYLVGFGDNYPKFPHHRAASGRLEGEPAKESKNDPERHILYGAMVGGPGEDDSYSDDIDDYVYTEVGLDYNAGILGALAGMTELYGAGEMPEGTPGTEAQPAEYSLKAKITYENNQQTVIDSYMHNVNFSPPHYEDGISMRYFVDLTEFYDNGYSVSDVKTGIDYTSNGAVVSEMLPWNVDKNIYYAEITWPKGNLFGECQAKFKVYSQNTTVWDYENDFSRNGLKTELSEAINMGLYQDGELVYGSEPGGGSVIPPATPSPTDEPVTETPVLTTNPSTDDDITSTPVVTPNADVKCSIDYNIVNDWGIGATNNVTIYNDDSKTLDGWKLEWNFDGNQKISTLWSGDYKQSGTVVIVNSMPWNSNIAPNNSTSFGFNITYTGSNTAPKEFKLNGVPSSIH